jgi:NAD(P)-dependent dehydrogenase (short-subunit alcohol dehydrogenase family)
MNETPAASTPRWSPPALGSMVALVTGASRGVGRGVALSLGDCGAKVWVTGRSVRGRPTTENLPGTVEDTANEVTARGGTGIAVRCDHTIDADVEAVFARIASEDGRLDLLVNNAWAGYERAHEARFDAPFWEQPMWRYDLFAGSLRGQFLAGRLAAPLMLSQRKGLIANISFSDRDVYLGQVAYDICKLASGRMAGAMARELRSFGVAAVALHPGLVRTERVEAAWRLLGEGPAQVAHSPEYVGRSIAALVSDPDLIELSGQSLAAGDLAARYGFTDVDGRRPPAFRLEGRITLAARMERLNRITASQPGGDRG